MKKRLPSKFLKWEKTTSDTLDYKKTYIDMADDLISGIVLSHIIYWYLPSKNGDGNKLKVYKDGHYWLAVQRKDWWDRVRITPDKADRALKILEEKGLIYKERYKFYGNPTVHIRLNEEVLMREWKKYKIEDLILMKKEDDFSDYGIQFPTSTEMEIGETPKSLT
jgi:hypothetical protein